MTMHSGAAKYLSFFSDKDEVFISAIVPFLNPILINTNEFVYTKKEYAEELYFIVNGIVSYTFGKDNQVLTTMHPGLHFGDIEVMLQIPRKFSAKVIRESELLIMNKKLLREISEDYPNL